MTNIVIIGEHQFTTLVAETLEDQIKGLMFREWPPPVMSFPYKTAEVRKFWMKNTVSPLDIIFCRAGKIIGIFDGEPMSTACIGPNEPSDLVVELPRGKVEQLGIRIGDCVEILSGTSAIAKKFERILASI